MDAHGFGASFYVKLLFLPSSFSRPCDPTSLTDQQGGGLTTEAKLLFSRSLTVGRLYLKLFEPPQRERCLLRAHLRLVHCLSAAQPTTRMNWPAVTITPRCKLGHANDLIQIILPRTVVRPNPLFFTQGQLYPGVKKVGRPLPQGSRRRCAPKKHNSGIL